MRVLAKTFSRAESRRWQTKKDIKWTDEEEEEYMEDGVRDVQ